MEDSNVTGALRDYFNSEIDFHAFIIIIGKIVQLLSQLVKDGASRIGRSEMVSTTVKIGDIT